MKVYASSIGIAVAGVCVGVGCPQLRKDDFGTRLGDVGAGGTASGIAGAAGGDGQGGSGGGSNTCDARSGGCGVDAGPGGAGAGGAGEDAGTFGAAQADSGTEPEAVACALDEETGPNGECYFVDGADGTWSEARTSCQSRGIGWDLVSISDAAENDFVLSITGYEAWIGATDGVAEGTWSWVGEGAPFFEVDATESAGFAYWSDGEPNDFDGSDCLRILTTGLWADWPCDSLLGHVCERRTP